MLSVADVSVVVPHYGDPAVAEALVTRLLAQSSDLEVIVVDDASPVAYPEQPGVRVVRRERNGGFGSAVNTGAGRATRPYLLILNSDLEVPDDFVPSLLAAASPWLPAVVGPAVVDAEGEPGWTGRRFPAASHQTVEWLTPLARWRQRAALHRAVGHDTRVVPGATVAVDWLVGACLLLPTREFAEAGGFDERFFMNSEEIDLQRRLRQRGLPSVHLGDVVVTHRGGASSDPQRSRAWLVDSRIAYARKWGGVRRLRVSLLGATAVNLLVNAGRRAAGRDVAPLRTAREELSLIRQRGDRAQSDERRTSA